MTFSAGLTAALALAAVLGLVLAAARLARSFGLAPASRAGPGGPERRLVLLEAVPLDGRRRLQLVRCDGQHLVILTGGPQDLMLRLRQPGAG